MISPLRSGVLRLVFDRVALALHRVPRLWPMVELSLRERHGIEIAGPSPTFSADGLIPVYPIIGSLENYGFRASDGTFEFSRRVGRSHPCEATALPRPDNSTDFVLSSHVLEHIANPLRALVEWYRILRSSGHLLMLLPQGTRTYDHRRPVTDWTHLVADFERRTPETDHTHIEESVRLTDINHWSFSASQELESLFAHNVDTRNAHHHVFDVALATKAVTFAGFRILATEMVFPFHIAVFATK